MNKEKIVGVYLITCLENGKQYVGQSIDINRRKRQHQIQTSNKYLKEDIERYGWDAFKFQILEECEEKELIRKEDYYINLLNPGYNIIMEGRPVEVSNETREKQRQAKLGKSLSKEHLYKIGLSNRGKTISESARRKHFKPVICVETGVVFESLLAAAKFCNVKYNNLSRVLRNDGTAGGFHWRFFNEELEESRPKRPSRPVSEETKLKRCKSIVCVETGRVFASVKKAAEYCGIKPPNVSAALYGKSKAAGGFHWQYCDPSDRCSKELSEKLRKSHTGIKRSRETVAKLGTAVKCCETGEIFISLSEAALKMGTYETNISKVLQGKRNTAGGYHWELSKGG